MKHYGSADDIALNANLGFVLLDKEERKGLGAFSRAERFVYAVQGMMREVNNGGWSQFFFNSSGELAPDLAPALEAIGAPRNLSIARRALQLYGTPASLGADDRARRLSEVTRDGEDNPWEALEDEFYENPEDLDALLLRFIAAHPAEFSS
jgi:hypothetical protein